MSSSHHGRPPRLFVGVASLLLLLLLIGRVEPSCRASGLCCSGRNSTCLSAGWRSDRTYGNCYCDQACVRMLDCCLDYHAHCPAVSCVVSAWTPWSGCAEPCRPTVRRRSRAVLREPLNAGEACPPVEERAGCVDYHSQHGRCHKSLIPALITAGGYGNSRKKRELPDGSEIIGYCVQFQLTALTAGCQRGGGTHMRWMQYLRVGHHVCVECQPPALAAGETHCTGDGEQSQEVGGQPLLWQAVGNPRCRGAWRRVGRLESCSCPTAHSFLFI